MNKPLCPTCRYYTYAQARVAGQMKEWPACGKQVAGFPGMMECRDYEREPGSDDE